MIIFFAAPLAAPLRTSDVKEGSPCNKELATARNATLTAGATSKLGLPRLEGRLPDPSGHVTHPRCHSTSAAPCVRIAKLTSVYS